MIGAGAARPDEARRDPAQRRPRRGRRRGGRRRGARRPGRLAGAGIDVFEHEPPIGSPLLDAPNTLLTPHLGASTAEAQVAVAEEVADQVIDVLAGRSARYAVNAPLLTPETAEALAPYLPLAEILGRFFAQFCRTGVRTLTLEIAGELSAFDGSPLTAAVLRGLLETSTTERVNLVNAGRPRQGPRHHRRRAQDARRRRVRGAAHACRASRRAGRRPSRDRRRRRAAPDPPRRVPARHGAVRRDAHHPPPRPAGDDRPDRPDARPGRREHQRDAPRPVRARAPTPSWSWPSTTTSRRPSPRRSGPTKRSSTCG